MSDEYVGVIVECFYIRGRGRVVIVETSIVAPTIRANDKLLLALPDNTEFPTAVRGIEMVNYGPRNQPRDNFLSLLLMNVELLEKSLLIGSKVYQQPMIDELTII